MLLFNFNFIFKIDFKQKIFLDVSNIIPWRFVSLKLILMTDDPASFDQLYLFLIFLVKLYGTINKPKNNPKPM